MIKATPNCMDPILFIDNVCDAPYDLRKLETKALGGTEATIIRVAEGLSKKVPVVVIQHNRIRASNSMNVTYGCFAPDPFQSSWQSIIVMRNASVALDARNRCKTAPIWLWLHDLFSSGYIQFIKRLVDADIGIITVSDYQTNLLLDICKYDPYLPSLPKIKRIYNPIDDNLKPDDTPIDINKLLFVSSPIKGLDYTIEAFRKIQKVHPQFHLYLSNPGYSVAHEKMTQIESPNITYLGPLVHSENLKQMRSALCLFYLNHVLPETFGLTFAEANAIGTPVLTHPFGSAPEVLSDKKQLVNTHDIEAVTNRLLEWRDGNRIKVTCKDDFRLSTVIKQWEELLF